MKRLTAIDLGFIYLEKRNQPLHVAYLNLLTPPADAPPDFVQKLVERLRSYAAPLPPFNQRLESTRLGAAYWVEDPEFDIHQHVVHLSLPRPGRIVDLLAMVSRMHASHLDRAYPLWRTYVIEGVEGGRIATYSKMHHAVADGIAGTRLTLRSMSANPADILPPPWAVPPQGRRERPASLLTAPVTGAAKLALKFRDALDSVPTIARELRQSLRDSRENHPGFVSGMSAPPSILNRPISASRRFSARSYSLTRTKAAGRALGGTLNDMVLAMCSSALRRYLLELDELPDRPLIAGVPMSLRRDRGDSGNQVAFTLVNLGTHLADPGERLRTIMASAEHNRHRFLKMKPIEVLGYNAALMAPGMINMLTKPSRGKLAMNLIVSNVPGPRAQLYWMGCKVDGMYPVSVLMDGMALNLTLTSYVDRIDVGVIACRRTLPHAQRVLDHLETGLAELEALAPKSAAPKAAREAA